MDIELQEKVLWSWMQMSMYIRGNRLLQTLSFNEILVCNILYRTQQNEEEMLTMTDLCEATRLYKSQINRILCELEKKRLIERIRSKTDRRKTYICLVEENLSVYLKEHEQVLQVVAAVTEEMGAEKSHALAALLGEAADIVDRYQMGSED